MNERIRELLSQAALETNEDPNGEYPAHMVQKFAELIVEECIAVAKEEEDRYDSLVDELGDDATMCANAMTEYQLAVKEHFGVDAITKPEPPAGRVFKEWTIPK